MRKNLVGRHPLTVGAAVLLGLSVYEFWIRLEDFQAWFLGIKHLSEVRGTSFLQDLAIIFEVPAMRMLGFKMLYLAAVVVFAAFCLIRRNRCRGAWVILLLALTAGVCGVLLEFYAFSSWLQIIKLLPLALIAIGSISNIAQRQNVGKPSGTQPNSRIPVRQEEPNRLLRK